MSVKARRLQQNPLSNEELRNMMTCIDRLKVIDIP